MEKSEVEYWENFAAFLDLLKKDITVIVPAGFPDPAADLPAYWNAVRKAEMESRGTLSEMIRQMLRKGVSPEMSDDQKLMLRFRLEWAMEFAQDRMTRRLPRPTLREGLEAALVDSWETQGCQEFWRTDAFG